MKVGDNWGGGISKARRAEVGLSSWEGAASPHQLGGLGKSCGLPPVGSAAELRSPNGFPVF